jgi:vanillate O-demethylase monooxygenase subunit
MLMVENLLDLSHVQYVHPTTLGTDGVAASPVKTERDGEIVRVTRFILDRPAPPFFQKAGGYTAEEHVDKWQIVEFRPPCFIRLDIGCAPAGTGVTEGKRDHGLNLRHHSHMTPETDESHHYFFTEGHNFQIDDPTVTDMIFRQVRIAIMEDVDILKKQQININLFPKAPQISFRQDAAGVQARRLVDHIISEEKPELQTDKPLHSDLLMEPAKA